MCWVVIVLWAADSRASEEVAIEIPATQVYEISGQSLHLEDMSGDATPMAGPLRLALCGEFLCPPFQHEALPLKFIAAGPITINRRGVKGSLWLTVQKGKLIAINRLPLEEYLISTVGSEMPKHFPEEALKAQAVAARTYALSRKVMRASEVVHLASTVLDQVYGGLANESAETRAAVMSTAGEILVYERAPIDAYFFSSCSGKTREPKFVFGTEQPYLRSVECLAEEVSAWQTTLKLSEVSRKMGGKVERLSLVGRTHDGRPELIAFEPLGVSRTPEQLRALFGYAVIKSADFSIECHRGSCTISGRGAGHGVGMCQWGAKTMAQKGSQYRDILAHYYPGAEIKKLY